MFKKVVVILLSVLLFSGCESAEKQIITSDKIVEEESEIVKIEETEPEKKSFNGEEVVSKIAVKQYKYNSYGFLYNFMELTNNSDCTVDVNVNLLYYDGNDNLISAETMSEDVLMPGHSILMYNMLDEDYARDEYTLSVSEPRYYRGIQDDISYEVSVAKEKLVVTMTNNGNEAAEFVDGTALFFKGDEVVGHDSAYFIDDDSEIKPGASISKNLNCYEDFDGYKIYVTGRRY